MPTRSDAEKLVDALQRTGALLAGDADLRQIMQRVTDASSELTHAAYCAFFYNGPADAAAQRPNRGEILRLFTVSGADPGMFGGIGHPRTTALFAPTAARGEIVMSGDVTADPRYGHAGGMPRGHFPVRSYLSVPVTVHGKVVGTLMAGHPEPDVFGPKDEKVLCALGVQAAIAIENARLFGAHRALEEKLLEANERLVEANRRLAVRVDERTAERDRLWSLATDCMSVVSPDGRFAAANPAWTRLLGWREEELLGKPFMDFVHPEDAPATQEEAGRLFEAGVMPHFENRQLHKDGSFRVLSWSAVVDGGYIHSVGRDVTAERRQAEALERVRDQLRQAHKLEAIGVLARGVAHEFANCAAAVLAGHKLLDKKFGDLFLDKPTARLLLDKASEAAARGGATARRLLSFAKRGTLKPEPIPVLDLMDRIRDGLVSAAAGAINVVVVHPPDCPEGTAVVADPAVLAQTLIALVMNSRDAMPQGGTVTFSAHAETLNDGKQAGLFGGEYVRIDVADTGCGMDEMTRSRAAEPFFTTHKESDGKGLGLSSALGFAEQSGGSLRIASAPGEGTTVSIWLPKEARREAQ